MRPLSPIREFNWSQANRRVRQERAKLDSKDSRDICAPHDRPEHRAGIVFHLKLTLMARLRFYGSLVTISIRIHPTFCRSKKLPRKNISFWFSFSVQRSLAYFRLMHTSLFLSSPLYLLRPTRLNPPHVWRQYVLRSTFPFSK